MSKPWLFLFIKLISDVFAVAVSFMLGYMLKFEVESLISLPFDIYIKFLLTISILWVIIFNLSGLYKLQVDKANRIDNPIKISAAVFSSAFFTYFFVIYVYKEAFNVNDIIIYAFLISLILVNLFRYFIWNIYKKIA